jgi:hypothetical protein
MLGWPWETAMQFFLSLGTVNLALVSVYLVPVWGIEALRVLHSHFGGLHDRSHAAAVGLIHGHLGLAAETMPIISNALAGFKLLVVAAMVAFLVEIVRAIATRREPDRETMDVVLMLALVTMVAAVFPALALDDTTVVRSHAAQIMLVCGAIIVAMVERGAEALESPAQPATVTATEEPVEQPLAA